VAVPVRDANGTPAGAVEGLTNDQLFFVGFAQAWCAKICPTNAIVRDQATLAYKVLDDKCVGCKMCVLACPFGSVVLFPEKGKAEKCDHCLSIDGDPECVKFCTPQALEYLDEDNETRLRQMATALKLKETYEEVTV